MELNNPGNRMVGNEKINILVVDDDKPTAHLLETLLQGASYSVVSTNTADQAIQLIKEKTFPIVVSDIDLGRTNGLTLLPHVKAATQKSAIIFITGQGSIDTAVKAIREGAFDYLCKTPDLDELETNLKSVVERAARHLELLDRGEIPKPVVTGSEKKTLIGRSPGMVIVYRNIAKAALFRGNVLIIGESGTGKELVAQAIHQNSPWADKPFVTVNCGALTETLLESELFGHVRGSFTGAVANKRGLFEEANGGTLFLDEIGDISPGLQLKLLRAIQEGEIRPVGGSQNLKVNVRVITATHRNLREYVRLGKFREDLYYRLKVFMVDVPPLRERAQDIPELVEHFIGTGSQRLKKNVSSISNEALELLIRYPWPGNIRELENAVERAMAMANSTILFPEDFSGEVRGQNSSLDVPTVEQTTQNVVSASQSLPQVMKEPSAGDVLKTLEDVEKEHIVRILENVRYNKSRAAEILGIDRVTLYRKAVRYGIPMSANPKEETPVH